MLPAQVPQQAQLIPGKNPPVTQQVPPRSWLVELGSVNLSNLVSYSSEPNYDPALLLDQFPPGTRPVWTPTRDLPLWNISYTIEPGERLSLQQGEVVGTRPFSDDVYEYQLLYRYTGNEQSQHTWEVALVARQVDGKISKVPQWLFPKKAYAFTLFDDFASLLGSGWDQFVDRVATMTQPQRCPLDPNITASFTNLELFENEIDSTPSDFPSSLPAPLSTGSGIFGDSEPSTSFTPWVTSRGEGSIAGVNFGVTLSFGGFETTLPEGDGGVDQRFGFECVISL